MIIIVIDPALGAISRPLTEQEQEPITWLIDDGECEDRHSLRAQIMRLTVRDCTCGCLAVYFALNGTSIPSGGERLVSDYMATVNSMEVGVMLFETAGHLSSLEVYSCRGPAVIRFTRYASIQPY
jgi:hypothetical protein